MSVLLVLASASLLGGCNGNCPPFFSFCTPVWVPLEILSWNLEAGANATVEAEFQTDAPVFRERFDAPSYRELGLVTLEDATGENVWWAARRDVDPRWDPTDDFEAEVDILTQWRFRFVSATALAETPRPPYTLHIGVRRGEGPTPGWPNIEARAQFGPGLVTEQAGPP